MTAEGPASVLMVQEVDDGLGALAEHHLADDGHVGAPVLLGLLGLTVADQLDQALLGPDTPAAGGDRSDVVVAPAHGGDGPDHDLVEHLGQDAQGLIARQRDQALVEAGVGRAERLGVLKASHSSSIKRTSSFAADFLRRDEATALAAKGSNMLRASKTSAKETLRDWSTSAAVLAVIRWSGDCTTTPPWRPRTTRMSPSVSRMRSASRNEGRDTPNRSTRSGSRPRDSPSESFPLTIDVRSSSAIC